MRLGRVRPQAVQAHQGRVTAVDSCVSGKTRSAMIERESLRLPSGQDLSAMVLLAVVVLLPVLVAPEKPTYYHSGCLATVRLSLAVPSTYW